MSIATPTALPVTDLEYGPELSGPGELRGRLSPRLVASHPTLADPGTTLIYVESDTSDFKILTRSTLSSKETTKWEDGKEYPLIKVEISSASHPFYTGKHKVMDTSGRIDKFQKRYAR